MTSLFLRWMANMVGVAPERPPTRLAEARVLELARAALSELDVPSGDLPPLVVRDVVATGSGTIWVIDTATRGSGASVRVSDADGRVVEVRRRRSR